MKNALDVLGRLARKLLGMFRQNWGYKLVAFLFAIILWALVMSTTNPLRTLELKDVPVYVENLDELQLNGLTLIQSADTLQHTASVKVQVRWNDYNKITKNDITLKADLSKVTRSGTQKLTIIPAFSAKIDSVQAVTPDNLEVTIDDYIERTVPIEAVPETPLPEGYWTGGTEISPALLRVKGPRTIVSKISMAQVSLRMDSITSDYMEACSFVLLDQDRNPVDTSVLSVSENNVIVSMTVRPIKKVPVLAGEAVIGGDMLPEGFEITAIETYPNLVAIAAPSDILNGVAALGLSVVDVSGATGDVSGTATLIVPDGVTLLDGNTVEIVVRISEIQTEMRFEDLRIVVRNLSDGLRTNSFTQTANVTVTGPVTALASLYPSVVKLYVDTADLGPGTYNLPVYYDIDDRYRVSKVVTDPEVVEVVISEK